MKDSDKTASQQTRYAQYYLVEEFVEFYHLVRVYSELSHVGAVLQQAERDGTINQSAMAICHSGLILLLNR